MNRMKLAGLCAGMIVLLQGSGLEAQQWGNLKVRFAYDGDAPKAQPIEVTKDEAYCGKFKPMDETLVVNAENNGIANVIVYVRTKDVAIHPDYDKLLKVPGIDKITHDAVVQKHRQRLKTYRDEIGDMALAPDHYP